MAFWLAVTRKATSLRLVRKREPSPSTLSTKQPSSRGWVGSFVTTVAFLAAALILALNSQAVLDTVNYYQYQPTDQIVALATDSGMNDKGRFLFYTSRPSLESNVTFNTLCTRADAEANTAILGCYNGQNIYIYDVTDVRLSGVRETTAAHEMLHAAYKRLSDGERKAVDQLLEAEYATLKSDQSIETRMAFYDRTEPGERVNELHSLIGTEIATISPELEKYYEQYFADRSKVVTLYQNYNSIFKQLKEREDELKAQLSELHAAIESDSASYNAEAADVQRSIGMFNNRAQRGGFASQAEFAVERQRLVARLSALETLRSSIDSNISRYNQLTDEFNSIATKTNELYKSMNSSLAPPPSI